MRTDNTAMAVAIARVAADGLDLRTAAAQDRIARLRALGDQAGTATARNPASMMDSQARAMVRAMPASAPSESRFNS